MSSPEEIWSTRLQREILALEEEELENKSDLGILPPFISCKSHHLDINDGICTVKFAITVEGVERAPPQPKHIDRNIKRKVDSALGEKEEEAKETVDEAAEKETEESNLENDGETKAEIETAAEMDATERHSNESPESTKFNVQIEITLDASLQKRNTVFSASSSYPFYKPRVILTSGAEHFTSMKIENGDEIQMSCDWTPSLHLNDAAMDIALKVRESIKRGEPCLKVVQRDVNLQGDLLDEVKADISKAGAKVSSFFSDLKIRASAVAEELDHAVGSGSTAEAASGGATLDEGGPRRLKKISLKIPRKEKAQKPPAKIVTVENIEIGDEIDLADDPWSKAAGLYPCKAIRRPGFISDAMEVAGQNKPVKVANAGLSGAGSMFRSFTKSAKSLVEESFLMLTEDLLVEIKCNKFAVATATVTCAIPVSHLAKLKFRREESISLFFKQAPDDPIIYMCTNSADAVKQIQNVLKRHGVKGKHTNSTMQKTVQAAVQMIEDIKSMEQQLQESPSAEKVTVIMDLYRQAAEKFELAGDARHEEAMSRMRDFLASPLVISILEESEKEKQEQAQETPVVVEQQSILESEKGAANDPVAKSDEPVAAVDNEEGPEVDDGMEKAMEEAENMLKSAHDDLADLDIDDFDDLDDDVAAPASTSVDDITAPGDDVISEFEDMLKDADKELQELMDA